MKVCILSPTLFYIDNQTQPSILYHIPYLYSYLRQHLPEVEVSVVDFELETGHIHRHEDVDEFMRIAEARLRRTNFDVVGISCWTSMHYLSTLAFAHLCKHLNPDCKVVVGGYHPSYMPQDFEFPGTPVDYIVLGEGEEAFRRIVAGEIPPETKPQRVQGVPTDLADLHLLWDEYPYYRNASLVGLWLSRGCPFSCGYCLDRLTRYRGYTARQAVSQLQRVIRLLPNLQQIMLCDALFGLSKEWRREFLPLLVAMKPEVEFWTETRVDLVQPEDLDWITRLRFRLDLGLEHVSPRMLTIMKKTNNPQKYLERWEAVDAYMNEKWIPHAVYLIANYPGETSETQHQLYDYWMRYYRKNPDNWTNASPSLFCYYPGAEVFINWKHYEETYGARVMYPEWWKIAAPHRRAVSGAIIPSRELMEASLVHRGPEYVDAMWSLSLQLKHPQLEERWPSGFGRPGRRRRVAPEQDDYLDDKPLQLQELCTVHEKVNTNLILYNFETQASLSASQSTSGLLRSLLQEGSTIATLVERYAAVHPDPEACRRKLRKAVWNLIYNRFLTMNLAPRDPLPPPPDRPLVVLRTTAGRVVLELFGAEVPQTVSNFLYLVRRRFYDGLFFYAFPEAFVQTGAWNCLNEQQGPGYTLECEFSPFPHERGSVSMLRDGPLSHGSEFKIWLSTHPRLSGSETVFGRVLEGMPCVDRILTGQDWIRAVRLEEGVSSSAGGNVCSTDTRSGSIPPLPRPVGEGLGG